VVCRRSGDLEIEVFRVIEPVRLSELAFEGEFVS
jgi:hypothetical protein